MAKTESLQLRRRATALLLMATVLLTSVVSVAAYSRTAIIDDGENETTLSTSNIYTDHILDTAEIQLSTDDQIVRTDENGVITIKILRAFDVTVNNHGEQVTVKIAQGTVEDVLKKAGITVKEGEVVTPALTQQVNNETEIFVKSTFNVKVKADNKTQDYTVTEGKVEQAIALTGLEIGEDDIISPDKDSEVTPEMTITVKRVTYKEVKSNEKIKYDTVEKRTNSLYRGETEVQKNGVNGEKTVTKKQTYVDGELTQTKTVESKVTKNPVDKIVLVGTKSKASSNQSNFSGSNVSAENSAGSFRDSNGNSVYYSSKMVGTATAYSSNVGSVTSTGVPVYYGGVAVDPSIIPYGSKLYIVSNDGAYVYGYATAVDTGGAMLSGHALVDLFYPSESQCVQFGRRTVTIYVL